MYCSCIHFVTIVYNEKSCNLFPGRNVALGCSKNVKDDVNSSMLFRLFPDALPRPKTLEATLESFNKRTDSFAREMTLSWNLSWLLIIFAKQSWALGAKSEEQAPSLVSVLIRTCMMRIPYSLLLASSLLLLQDA